MPQPRQVPEQPPADTPSGAPIAATATPYVAGALGPALMAAGATVLGGAALAAAVTAMVKAFLAMARARFDTGNDFVLTELKRIYPDRKPSELARLVDQEARFEKEFRRKMGERLRVDLPEALAIADDAARKAKLEQIFAREKRFTLAREEAMFMRALGKAEVLLLKETSPHGAYWKLSPFVKEHTLDCLAVGEKFWPWEALEDFQPPVHHGCACYLLGLDEALRMGLMTADQVPDPGDAVRRFKRALADAEEMEEALDEEMIRAYIDGLAIEESDNVHVLPGRQPARWAKGYSHGGQFRPRRGGDRGDRSLRALFPHPKSPAALRGERRGRWTWINGVYTRVPEADAWETKVAGRRYTSPAGSTNVYRDGQLMDGMGLVSDERRPRLASGRTTATPASVATAAAEMRRGMRSEALARMDRSPVRPPVQEGDGPSSLLALRDAGFALESVSHAPAGARLRWRQPDTGTEMSVVFDGQRITSVNYQPTPPPRDAGKTSDDPPNSFEDFVADGRAWATRIAYAADGAPVNVRSIATDRSVTDHAGSYTFDGDVRLGPDVERDIERAARARRNGRPLNDSEARGVWSAYWAMAHEAAGHGVNPIPAEMYVGAHANLEEALVEELAHARAAERLKEQGQTDVLKWRDKNPDALAVRGVYRNARAALGGLLDAAGVEDHHDRLRVMEDLKYKVSATDRPALLADMLVASGAAKDHAAALERVIGDLERPRGNGGVLAVTPPEVVPDTYGSSLKGELSADGTELKLPDGSRRRIERLPIPADLPELVGLTDGTAIVAYPRDVDDSDGPALADGSPKAYRWVDSEERAKTVLRAYASAASPGTGGGGAKWFKKLTHSGQGDLLPGEQAVIDQAFAESAPKPKDKLDGTSIGGVADAPEPTGTIPSYDATELKLGSMAGGSNGARWAFDGDGNRWLLKTYRGNRDRIATELLSNAIYRTLGAKAARAGTITMPPGPPDFRKIPDVEIEEPPLPKKGRISTGMIVAEPDGRIWVYEPKDHFGGYEHTFPKGGLSHGLTAQQNAHAELWEETGLHAHVTSFLGDYEGDTGTTRYYLAVRTGGEPVPGKPGETEAVKLVTPAEAAGMLNRDRDKKVLSDALAAKLPTGEYDDRFPTPEGAIALTYPTLDGETRKFEPSEALGEHYMVDALLANWDFVGKTGDNVLWDGETPIRIDQGGTLEYRAQGQAKPFGPVPTEVWTMLSKGQGKRGVKVTEDQMRAQAKKIATRLTDGRIDRLVEAAPFGDEEMAVRVRENLKARRDWMRAFAAGDVSLPKPAEGAEAHESLWEAQSGLQLYPEQEDALFGFAEGGALAVNEALKDRKEPSATVGRTIDEMDSLMRHATTGTDVVAYATLNLPDGDALADLEGKTLQERGFMALHIDAPDARALLRITVPEGSHAIYTGLWEDMPAFTPDLIVSRDARLRISGRRQEGETTIFDATLVTQKPFAPWKGGGKSLKEAETRADAPLHCSVGDRRALLKHAGPKAKGVSLKRDKNGFFVHTHRARSRSFPRPDRIPKATVAFIESTG
ncbi:MAG: NUDIX domain-containing protein [Baekduia sp.]